MARLINCFQKTVGKLITKEDADQLLKEAKALEAGGLTPIAAEQQAVKDAHAAAVSQGEAILHQILAQRPQAYAQAEAFWKRETLRPATAAGLPRFVTEGVTRAEVPGVPSAEAPAPRQPGEPPSLPPEAPSVAEAPAAEAPAAAPEAAPAEIPPPVTPPPVLVGPISDAAQAAVNSLPEEQRNEAQKAFAQDDRDVRADEQRSKGQPVSKRKDKAIAPEKNTGLINDLSRYGVFDKSVAEVLSNIASDPKAPRWIKLLANLFTQLGLGEDVSIRVVNTPKADWRGLYHFNRETGKGEVLINLSHSAKPGDLARIILHELMHHGTLRKLTTNENDLTPTELAAKRSLQNVFDYVKAQPKIFKGKAAEFGATESLTEFVSEIFANDKLRVLLNSIKPDGKVSLLQRFTDAVLNLFVGERFQIGMRKGSLLEAAIKEAIKVAGSPAVETPSGGAVAAMQARDESYRAIDQQWWKDFMAWEEGKFHAPKLFQFGLPSDEQIAGGFPDGGIVMAPRVLEEKPAKHGFKARELFNLPKRLRDPIAIFQSRTEPDAKTVLTTIEHEGQNMLAAVHFNPTKEGESEITHVQSVYPKDANAILGWINDGLTTYYHKEKAWEWLTLLTRGSNSPTGRVQSKRLSNRQEWLAPFSGVQSGLSASGIISKLQTTPNVKTNEDIVKGPEGEGPIVAAMAARETKKWFGESKVINEEGQPKRMFHGTTKEFGSFSPEEGQLGVHVGTLKQSELFAAREKGRMIPLYVKVENPLRLEDMGIWDFDSVAPQLKAAGIIIPNSVKTERAAHGAYPAGKAYNAWSNKALQGLIEKAGYDGIVYLNRTEGVDHEAMEKELGGGVRSRSDYSEDLLRRHGAEDSFIVFHPDQLRSTISPATRANITESRVLQYETEEQARLDKATAAVQPKDRANDGGVDPPSVAAMAYQDESEPTRDPHGGRTSLVRSMVNRITGASRDRTGIEVPKSEQEVRGVAGIGGREDQGRKGSAPLWRNLGETFRKREASLYSQIDGAAKLIAAANPEDSENAKDPARYQNSQALLDYLSGKEIPADSELKTAITELRKEIPVIPQAQFKGLSRLDSGSEADVYHDTDSGVVYKFFHVRDGALGDSYVPGPMRLDRAGRLLMSIGEMPTLQDFLSRMERANSQGALTPHELIAITPEGQLVFASPFVEGREVTKENLPAALARAGIHFLSDSGGGSGIAKVDNRWVLYDDLHPGNVRTMPGGRVEIIDANNRELDQYEIADLHTLGKMPPEKPLTPTKAKPPTKKVQKYENATVIAPMVETHHGTPHEWAPEKRVRLADGTLEWMALDRPTPSGATVIERAPAGRVREDKVGTGETNAAFGWGVLYSAARKALAEHYRDILSEGKDARSFISLIIPGLHNRFKQAPNRAMVVDKLGQYNETKRLVNYPDIVDLITKAASGYDRKSDTYTPEALRALQQTDKLLPSAPAGNVYTVQLDVDDPELLDWFMPMKDQMFVFDKVTAQFGTTREDVQKAYEHNEMLAELANNMQAYASRLEREADPDVTPGLLEEITQAHADAEKRWEEHFKQPDVKLGGILARMESMGERYTGEKFYERLTEILKHSPKAASKHLDASGVPGIVFIDRESRKPNFEFDVRVREGQTETLRFDTQEEAEYARNSRIKSFPDVTPSEIRKNPTFNNYVVFDPERIKVVAKNGEVVKTVADDLPAPPEPNIVEPVTVAAMAAQDIKDDTDLTVNPMAGTGRRARKDVSAENYKPAGWTAPFKRLSWEAVKFAQKKSQMEAATVYRIQTMVKDFEGVVKKAYKGKLSPEENKNIMTALGNLDNRLTQEQAREAKKMTGAEREGFLHTAHLENVARFKQQQEQALNSLPDEIREAINVLREALDLESKEALKDTGLDTELRARLDANQGVFLHSNAFQHFEDDVWGKDIRKSDDPEAKRIRAAAENLFRNEIIGENAFAYQKEQKAKGIDVSDEDALRFAAESGDLEQQKDTRLDDYLNKQADEPSRLHMLMGKMPVTRTEAGKMVSLDRENIPKEIRELWGQYDDPATNFAKTLSVLANHNAQTRMQNSMLDDGLDKGYFWKQGVSPGPRPSGLVRMTSDTRGPMVGVHGPRELKEGLSLMNQRPVRSLMSELNSVPLMMKTRGSIGSAVRNFFGNPLFMVSNGNLPISAIYWPKAFWLSLQRAADSMATPEGRKQLTRMIELGVLDESVDAKIIERISKNARTGYKWENQAGFGASVAAVQRGFTKVAEKTMIPTALRGIGTAHERVYMMADNFWRLANYNVELLRQKWMNKDLSLEEQEENAAEITRKTLPTYSNIVEDFRESYGKFREVAAPYLSFQAEAVRTYASSVHLAYKEISSGKPKEILSGMWRLGGLALATTAPLALGAASKAMFGYDDDDEKAIRAGLPEYQRSNMLFFLPRGPNDEPRYIDLNFVNLYSLVHTAITAAWRGEGVEGAAQQLAKPLVALAPVPKLITEVATNKGAGGQIYDPYASGGEKAASILKRVGQDVMPGTLDSMARIGEAYFERDILGNRLEKTGEKRDLREEVMKVFPGTADVTFDREKAMQMHVNEYQKAARNASGLFDKKISAEGEIGEGEVAEVTKEADERRYRAFQEMHKAYKGLTDDLGMKRTDAIKQMQIGFGSEIRKGGLSNDVIKQIVTGNYQRFMPSDALLKETAFLDSKRDQKRLPEFWEAQRQQPRSRTASPR